MDIHGGLARSKNRKVLKNEWIHCETIRLDDTHLWEGKAFFFLFCTYIHYIHQNNKRYFPLLVVSILYKIRPRVSYAQRHK